MSSAASEDESMPETVDITPPCCPPSEPSMPRDGSPDTTHHPIPKSVRVPSRNDADTSAMTYMTTLEEERPYLAPPPPPPPPPLSPPPTTTTTVAGGPSTRDNNGQTIFRGGGSIINSAAATRFEFQTRALPNHSSLPSGSFEMTPSCSVSNSRSTTPIPTLSKRYVAGASASAAAAADAAAATASVLAKPVLKKLTSSSAFPAPVIAAAQEVPLESSSASASGNGAEQLVMSDRVRLGVCAMDKKARSKPMAEILSRLDENLFHVVFFGDDLILNRPVEEWPVVQVLIAFYSKGYPLSKAKEYVALRNPKLINDLEMQSHLKDRRRVYDLLEASGIDVPRHVFVSRDGYESTGSGDGDHLGERSLREFDDHIEINGKSIHKPFVEKPVDADDHNIAIYYPASAGGGCKKLFRKIGNRSSEFYPDINEVRRDGSYIYEEFVETQGTDVKMYTVGPEYGHAEARKSPTVDGKVQRNEDGKEIRFPVILTLSEKEIARRIVLQFKQFVCGFDLLRVQEGHSVVSYVCDVNGFSFVKNSRKYYDDCAQILTEHMLAAVKPKSLTRFSTLDPLVAHVDDEDSTSGYFNSFRHGSTLQRVARLLKHQPSQTTMVDSSEDDKISLSPSRSEHSNGVLSTDDPTTLEGGALPVRQMAQELVSEPASLHASRQNSSEDLRKRFSKKGTHQEELRCVIAVVRHGDRTPKQKLKVNTSEPLILRYFHDQCGGEDAHNCTKDLKVKAKTPLTKFLVTVKTILDNYERQAAGGEAVDKKIVQKLRHMRDVLERWKITGLNRKLQIKPRQFAEDPETGSKRCTEVQLILKWGGNLTKLGENQAIRLGQQFRQKMYPDAPGGGILRLHSTFRHDLKIKTSDEGRVMKTAAAFAKGLLELEGEIPPILVSLVHKEKGSMHMLDPSGDKDAKLELDECKEKITANLQQDIDWREMTEDDRFRMVGPPQLTAMRDALAEVGNPRKTLRQIYDTMTSLIEKLDEMLGVIGSGDERRIEGGEGLKGEDENDLALSGVKLYKGETLLELTERWKFIHKHLYDPDSELFDLSRIPDVHDNVRFDVLHNPHLGLTSTLEKLYTLTKNMADTVVPQEYGTTPAEKRSVGIKICSPLLEKIRFDLCIARTDNKADMRYMINYEYSADLPINTMGRRIRTRLYFTSESHLHTMLNVLRFASADASADASAPVFTSPCLSEKGMQLLNDTREICYLTQIVFRLFEDTGRSMDDPRRFRVEILFSAGATATPFHMAESTRESDTTRLDTEVLHAIGRDNLTCTEVEAFFASIISEGGNGDDQFDVASVTTADLARENPTSKATKSSKDDIDHVVENVAEKPVTNDAYQGTTTMGSGNPIESTQMENTIETSLTGDTDDKLQFATPSEAADTEPSTASSIPRVIFSSESSDTIKASNAKPTGMERGSAAEVFRTKDDAITAPPDDKESPKDKEDKHNGGDSPSSREVTHKYFYITVAMGTLLLGASCLIMALGLTGGSSPRYRRQFTRR